MYVHTQSNVIVHTKKAENIWIGGYMLLVVKKLWSTNIGIKEVLYPYRTHTCNIQGSKNGDLRFENEGPAISSNPLLPS